MVRADRERAAADRTTATRCSSDPDLDVLYLAVPHHLHEELYLDDDRGRQGLPRREAVRHRPRRRPPHRRGARGLQRLRPLLERDALLPRRPARLRHDPLRRARRADRGRARLPALQRPRPRQADQLEAPGRVLRRGRRHERPRHARAAPAAAARLAAAQRPRDAPGHRPAAARPRRRARPLRHLGQRDDPRRRRLPAHARDQADRPRRDEHVADPRARDGRRRRVLDRQPEGGQPLRRPRRPPGLGAARDRQPVRLPDGHRADLRVRLLRRDPADVGGLPRGARGRPRRPPRLRHSAGGPDRARDLPRRAGIRRVAVCRHACPIPDRPSVHTAPPWLVSAVCGGYLGYSLGRSLERTHSRPERPAGGMGKPSGRLRRLRRRGPRSWRFERARRLLQLGLHRPRARRGGAARAARLHQRRPPGAVARAVGRRGDVRDRRADLRARLLRGARPRALPVDLPTRSGSAPTSRSAPASCSCCARGCGAPSTPRCGSTPRSARRRSPPWRRRSRSTPCSPTPRATAGRSRPTSPIRSPTSACWRSS